MALSYYPFSSGAGANANEAAWRQIFVAMGTPGVIIGQGNEMIVSAPGGAQVSVDSGSATCFATACVNPSPLTVAVTANGTGSIRYDRVVVQFDFQNDLAAIVINTGTNTAPPALAADITNLYEISLAVLAVPVGSGSVASGDLTVALDRWAAPVNQLQVGFSFDFLGLLSQIPKIYLPMYGQTVSRWSYEKWWNYLPNQGGSGTPPFHGRKNDSTNNIVVPDFRGRGFIGLDQMGQGSGHDAGRIDATDTIGNVLGSNAIGALDLAPHNHFVPDLDEAGTNDDYSGILTLDDTGTTGWLATSSTGSSHATAVHTMQAMKNNRAQNARVDDWPESSAPQNDDSKMPPAMMGYKLMRIA